MHRMGEAVEGMARQMHRLAEHSRSMMGEERFARDREMQQNMERLREHMNEMAEGMENTLRIMERIRSRLEAPEGGS